MRLYRFDPGVARAIDRHGSSFLQCLLSVTDRGGMAVSVMHLRPGDHVGRHAASVPQLFAVVEGAGHVQGDARADVAISAGQAAFWGAGESHAARTSAGMTVIVLEGAGLDPAKFMPAAG
jgi:hypothetical protein